MIAVTHESLSALGLISPAMHNTSPSQEADDNTFLHVSSSPMERTQPSVPGLPHKEGVSLQSGVHRYLPERVRRSMRWQGGGRSLVVSSMPTAYQQAGATSSLISFDELFLSRPPCSDQIRQGETRTFSLFKQCRFLLLWYSIHFLSVRATHVPGHLNLGPDVLSCKRLEENVAQVIPATFSSTAFELMGFCPAPFTLGEQRRLHSLGLVISLCSYIDRSRCMLMWSAVCLFCQHSGG